MTNSPSARPADRLMILAAAILFSTGGVAVKACSLTGWQVAGLRSGIAAAALLFLVPAARRGWTWRTWLVGAAYAGTMITFVIANKLTLAANAVFLQDTAPLYILILGPILLGEPVRRRHLFFIVALAVGMAMFFVGLQPGSETAPDPLRGNLIGAGCGVFWALTILGLRWLGRRRHSPSPGSGAAAAVVCGNSIACLVALPFALPIRGATPADWAAVVFLGVFQIAVAYVFMVRGMSRVGALEASLLVLLEPILSPVWAWLTYGETPSAWGFGGGAIIIVATALLAVFGGDEKTAAP
jgi:drug/metabolite transporter (DMT)-like permease